MSKLQKKISLFGGTVLLLNIVIGAGLLILPGIVYQTVGKSSVLAWLSTAIISIPLLLVFVILGKNYPDSGGIAHYAERVFGKIGQKCASILFLGAVVFGLPSIALTGGYYANEIWAWNPHAYASALILMTILFNLRFTNNTSNIFGVIGSFVIVTIIVLLLITAVDQLNHKNQLVILPDHLRINEVISPFMIIFFAFTGWEIGSHISEEFKDPSRDFPLAMVLSYIIATTLYLFMAFVVQNAGLNSNFETIFADVLKATIGDIGSKIVSVMAVIIVFCNLYGAIWGVSRLVYSLGRDAVLPKKLSYVNLHGTPVNALLITVSSLLLVLGLDWLGFFGISKMLLLAGQNFLILYVLAAICLFFLTKNFLARSVSVLTLLLSCAVLLIDHGNLWYPLALIILALVMHGIQKYYRV